MIGELERCGDTGGSLGGSHRLSPGDEGRDQVGESAGSDGGVAAGLFGVSGVKREVALIGDELLLADTGQANGVLRGWIGDGHTSCAVTAIV